jgi:hypothetical protein
MRTAILGIISAFFVGFAALDQAPAQKEQGLQGQVGGVPFPLQGRRHHPGNLRQGKQG